MRKMILVGLAVSLSFASVASAVEITVVEPIVTITAGQSVTIDIQLANASLDAVTGFTGVLSGLNSIGGMVTSGQASPENFALFCGPLFPGSQAQGACFGGVPTIGGGSFDPNDLSAASLLGPSAYRPGDDTVRLISATHSPGSSSPHLGDLDPGVGGIYGVFDPIDITITILAATAGSVDLEIFLEFAIAGGAMGTATTSVALNVLVPEPGTALLMGLGLAGLGVAGRRELNRPEIG